MNRRPIRKTPGLRDLAWFLLESGVEVWGWFERPWSFSYPFYKEAERFLGRRYSHGAIDESLRRFRRRGLTRIKSGKNGELVVLTKEGQARLRWHLAHLLRLKKVRWDGRWRLVLFDIPDKMRPASERFRSALIRLGLKKLQGSVWVSRLPCEQEVRVLASLYGVRDYVRFVEATHITSPKASTRRSSVTSMDI